LDTISDLINEQCRRTPSAPAIVYGGQVTSYIELEELAARAATGLARLGVGRGDRVAIWLPNTPAYLALWLGAARLGAIAVAVNTRFRGVEVADILARSGARVLAMWPGFRSIAFLEILSEADPSALARLESIVLYGEGAQHLEHPDALGHCRAISYDDLVDAPAYAHDAGERALGCNIFTTSGTTKAPKFVLHSHGSVIDHARTVAQAIGYATSTGGVLQALPLCGVFGFCQATAGLAAGRALLLMNTFEPDHALRLIDQYQVEYLNGTDDMLTALFNATEREIAMPSVKNCGFASFAAQPETFMALASARGLTLLGLYGMSEVQAFFSRQQVDALAKQRLLGGGYPLSRGATLRITDPATGDELPLGQHGEIELRGPSLMSAYFEDPQATAEAITADGYLRSGDLGYATTDGGFVYLARMGDVLRLGGFLVAPAEIEEHLNTHPLVTGAQVVGVNTERGVRPVGFVTLTTQATDQTTDQATDQATEQARDQAQNEIVLREHCLAGLAKFKAPDRILVVDKFPTAKSANGTKIQKARLREMAVQAVAGAT
jgi:fatty-acyl-CoA synthase